MTKLISNQIRMARTVHKCRYCGLEIEVNSCYQDQTFIGDDNKPYTWKSHLSCSGLAQVLFKTGNYEDGISRQDFHDFVNEYVSSNSLIHPTSSFRNKLLFALIKYKHEIDKYTNECIKNSR